MKTNTILGKSIKNATIVVILIGGMGLVSCSQKLCPAYEEYGKSFFREDLVKACNFESKSVPSSFTKQKNQSIKNQKKTIKSGSLIALR